MPQWLESMSVLSRTAVGGAGGRDQDLDFLVIFGVAFSDESFLQGAAVVHCAMSGFSKLSEPSVKRRRLAVQRGA